MSKIKLIIAEDQRLMREKLAQELAEYPQLLKVVGTAENGKTLLEEIEKIMPDMVLLDIKMQPMDGYAVLDELREKYPSIKTIIYSGEYSDYNVAFAVMRGARAYIDKNRSGISDIVKAITDVKKHGFFFNEFVAEEIIRTLNQQKKITYIIGSKKFFERDIEILKRLCNNKGENQIAEELFISRTTVKHHKKKIRQKTGGRTLVDLVIYAIRHGIYNIAAPVPPKKN